VVPNPTRPPTVISFVEGRCSPPRFSFFTLFAECGSELPYFWCCHETPDRSRASRVLRDTCALMPRIFLFFLSFWFNPLFLSFCFSTWPFRPFTTRARFFIYIDPCFFDCKSTFFWFACLSICFPTSPVRPSRHRFPRRGCHRPSIAPQSKSLFRVVPSGILLANACSNFFFATGQWA